MKIKLENFTKKYDSFTAVDSLCATFEPGKITGILGPNGAGKTTILKALTGRHFATEGDVLFCSDSEKINAQNCPEKIRNLTGFVEETPSLAEEYFVNEYIKLSAELHNGTADSVEKTISLCGLEEVKNKKIKTLSKGYRERVNFAQALVYNPKILVLDEPASGLDPQQIVKMREMVKELAKDKTIVISTHLMQEAEALCNEILIINKGKKLAFGSINEICRETKCKNLEEAFFSLINKEEESDE